jgi:two-component system, cell cycle response regulator DivK
MPDETILIVEDTPVSLKLAAAVLRAEGYKVHIASTAEQALTALSTVRPDLMLVDIRLPGMNGLDLTSHVKGQDHLKNTVVLALTSLTAEEVEQRALEAGCDGYLTKPIDTRVLAERVREFLDRRNAPSAIPADSETDLPLSLTEPEIEDLRRNFLEDGIVEARQFLASAEHRFDAPKAGRRLRQWAATAGLLGYRKISGCALEAETLVQTPSPAAAKLGIAFTHLVDAIADATQAVTKLPLPDSVTRRLSGRRIALVGVADVEAERLCAALERVSAYASLFEGNEPAFGPIRDCAVALVHVRPETLALPWLQPEFSPPVGMLIMLIGRRELLLSLDPAVRLQARDFLIDNWQPDEALMRLSFAMARAL